MHEKAVTSSGVQLDHIKSELTTPGVLPKKPLPPSLISLSPFLSLPLLDIT